MNLLLEAVSNFTDWHALGRRLGLTMDQLRGIELTYHINGLGRLKAEVFDVWLKSSPKASWADLITALRAMGEDRVASDIAVRHTPGKEWCVECCAVFIPNLNLVLRPFPSTNPDKVAHTSCWQQMRDSLVQFTNLCTSREAWTVVVVILAVVCVLFYKY